MGEILERQQFTPEGQELPAWLSYQAVTTTTDGVAVTTGTILKLPLTYYGPSIPLGPDWVYGGETSLATSSTPADSTLLSSSNPVSSPTLSSSASGASAARTTSISILPTSSLPSSTPLSTSSETAESVISLATITTSSSSAYPSSSALGSSLSTAASNLPSPSPSPTTSPERESDLRTTLLVLLPSILGPLILALLILLLCFCIVRRRRNAAYSRAPTSDPSLPIIPIPRRASSGHKLPFTPPRTKPAGTATEKAPLLAGPPSTGQPTAVGVVPAAEPEEEDIADFANPHRSSILSRLSLGLGIAPTMRRISNGTAEMAYRTPSWALLAAIPRRISSGFRSTSRTSAPPVPPVIVEKQPNSRGVSTLDLSSGTEGTTEPQSAGYARTMGDDELFYRTPGDSSRSSGEAARGSKSSRGSGSSESASSRSRSTRGTGPSNWQSAFPTLEEDGPPLYMTSSQTFGHQRGHTVSVGVPETPRTGVGSIGSFLGMEMGERDRRSRWVEEGDRMEFPVPPSGTVQGLGLLAAGNRESIMSEASGNSNYYSAGSHPASIHPETPPPYNPSSEPSTIRLVQPPNLDQGGDYNDATLRGHPPILASRMPSSQRGSDNTRRSFVGEPLLGAPEAMAEFGRLRSVSGGQINTLISAPNNSNARSSHYASIHVSDSSRSVYSHSSSNRSGTSSEQAHLAAAGEATENLVDSGVGATFGVVSDRALRGRRSQATLVSAKSVRLGHLSPPDVGGEGSSARTRGGPPVPRKNPARPPPLPRLSSETSMRGGAVATAGVSAAESSGGRRSWLGWRKDKQ